MFFHALLMPPVIFVHFKCKAVTSCNFEFLLYWMADTEP